MSTIKFEVCGIKWKAKVVSKKNYKDKCKDGVKSLAVTEASKRLIIFREDGLTKKIAVHELFHAHVHYLHINPTIDMSLMDFEEIIAEMLETRVSSITKTAKKILKSLKNKSNV